jgi:hypothetical protein
MSVGTDNIYPAGNAVSVVKHDMVLYISIIC